jgi:hypothetical protein
VAGLADQRARARAGQVGGGDQAVVAAADDDGIPGLGVGHGAPPVELVLTERSV